MSMNFDMSSLNLQNASSPKDATVNKKKRSMFSKEEDERLIKAVENYGDQNWSLVASYVGNRTRRQCSERWKKFLSPTINHSEWTETEDKLLMEKFIEFGPKWTTISKFFNNRTDVNVKSRFIIIKRRMKKRQEFIEKVKLFSKASIKSKDTSKKLYNISNINLNMNTNNLLPIIIDKQIDLISTKKNASDELSGHLHQNNLNQISHSDYHFSIDCKEFNEDKNLQISLNPDFDKDENNLKSFFELTFDDVTKYVDTSLYNSCEQEGQFGDSLFNYI
ncbi:hypothetical protein M9Y10_000909 [Tritrichomonas musculus]|uniref:Myb-like DNA-binding domain containing protein n=1 Tax=Tritrichomonas musculus TaxID=1915356 RepID=A0ABR2L5V2_9EUKA